MIACEWLQTINSARLFDVPLELSPVVVDAVRNGLESYGPRVWSRQLVKRLEDDCGEDLRAPGFPEYLVDHEPGAEGAEVVIENRQDIE